MVRSIIEKAIAFECERTLVEIIKNIEQLIHPERRGALVTVKVHDQVKGILTARRWPGHREAYQQSPARPFVDRE